MSNRKNFSIYFKTPAMGRMVMAAIKERGYQFSMGEVSENAAVDSGSLASINGKLWYNLSHPETNNFQAETQFGSFLNFLDVKPLVVTTTIGNTQITMSENVVKIGAYKFTPTEIAEIAQFTSYNMK